MPLAQPQQLQALPRAKQPQFVDRDDGVAIEFDVPGLRRFEEHGERQHVALRNARVGHVIGLPPGERGAIDLPALLTPSRDERLQRRRLPGPGGGQADTKPPLGPEPPNHGELRLAVLAGKVEATLGNLAVQQLAGKRRAAVLCGGLGEPDKFELLRLMQRCRQRDGPPLIVLSPDQRGPLAILAHALAAHERRHVVDSRTHR